MAKHPEQPTMPPLGGAVDSQPYAPPPPPPLTPVAVPRRSSTSVLVLLALGAALGGLAVFAWMTIQTEVKNAPRPPPLPPTPVVVPEPIIQTGTLVVESEPATKVTIDGRVVGETPIRMQLAAGVHAVNLDNPEDGIHTEFAAEIIAGETDREVRQYPRSPAPAGGCDEVSCVLNNYEGACCAKFNKHATPGTFVERDPNAPPESLDRNMISKAVNAVKPEVMACGEASTAKGKVKVRVHVLPTGKLGSVDVAETPDAALGRCVAAAMQKLEFPVTQSGGAFGYPFVF